MPPYVLYTGRRKHLSWAIHMCPFSHDITYRESAMEKVAQQFNNAHPEWKPATVLHLRSTADMWLQSLSMPVLAHTAAEHR